MKRFVSIMLALCIIFSVSSVFASNTEIIINGEKATIAEDMGSIVEKDWRTFVPVRFLLEHFGFNVNWEDETQTVLGRHLNGESFMMQVGNKNLFYFDANGNKKDLEPMDTTPFLNEKEGRTYIPLRFIAEAMGYKVDWDSATDTAILTK